MTNTEKTRIFNRGIARTTRSILLSLVYLAFLTTNLAAQSGGATTSSYKADQNLKSSARVNPSTLAMEFTLPITNYQGRNGNSVPIIFNYSSKLWGTTIVDSRSEDFISGGTRYINDFSKARLEYSKNSSSGWNSSLGSPKIVKSNSIFIEFGEYTSNSLGEDELPDDLLPEIDEIATSGSGNTVCRTTFEVIRSRLYECEVCFRVVNGVRVTYGYCRDRSGGDPPPGPDPSPTPPVRRILYYVWRVQIELQDGSTVEFRKNDKLYNCQQQGCLGDPNGTYLAVNGSRMRFERGEVQPDSTVRDVLYLPDGGRYVFPTNPNATGWVREAEKYIDVNGNQMLYDALQRRWTDTMGRHLVNPLVTQHHLTTLTEGTQQFEVAGIGTGVNRQYQLVWKKLKRPECVSDTNPTCGETVLENPSDALYYAGSSTCPQDWAAGLPVAPALFQGNEGTSTSGSVVTNIKRRMCDTQFGEPSLHFNPVVLSKVILPDQRAYEFKYNRYGEITKIIYPTGAVERFLYGEVQPIGYAMEPVYDQTNRGVLEHWVTDGDISRHWVYGYENIQVGSTTHQGIRATAPDGSKTIRAVHRSLSDGYGFEDSEAGFPFEERSYDSNGSLRQRKLTKWGRSGPQGPDGWFAANRDPKPLGEFSVSIEGQKALATYTSTEYDSHTDLGYFAHLNPKRVKSYHFLEIPLADALYRDFAWFEGQFASNGQLSSLFETDYSYDPNYKARGISSRPTETRVIDPANANNILAKTQTIYDNLTGTTAYPWSSPVEPHGGVGTTFDCGVSGVVCWQDPNTLYRGQPTTTRVWNSDAGQWIETHVQYDQFGNAIKARDPIGNETTTAFDPQYKYAYPTSVTTPAPDPTNTTGTSETSTVSTTYDLNTGLPLTVTDDFGQTTATEYNDPLLRPTRIIPPQGSGIIENVYGDQAGNIFIKTRKQVTANSWNESISLLDGLGRVFQTEAKDAQRTTYIDTEFDNMGRVKRSTKPYLQSETKNWVETVYDSAGRISEIVSPVISGEPVPAKIKTEYDLATSGDQIGTVVVGINQAGKKGRSILNALGQLIRFDELNDAGELGPINNPTQPTYYTYDRLGKLRKVSQGNQNRFFMYDALGRMIRIRQPEQDTNPDLAVNDPITANSQWSASFSYDNNGNLLSSTDAKGAVITYTYDRLDRLTTRNYSLPQTTDPKKITYATSNVTFKYDGLLSPLPNGQTQSAGPFSKGRLTEVNNGISISQTTSFDNQGRALRNQQITEGQVYPFQYEYNLAGKVTNETYPSGRTVTNSFDESSELSSVVSQKPGQGPRYYARAFQHNANGDISQLQLGNGRWETYQYNARNQLTQLGLGSSVAASNLWKVNYDYGRLDSQGLIDASKNDGNIIRQTITVPGLVNQFVQAYAYDPINRLSEAKESFGADQTWKQNYQHDRYGNRTGFTEIIGQTPTPLNNINHPTVDPTNNRFLTSQGYEYDFSGNLIQDAEGRKFKFDAENKQREVTDLSGNMLSTYSYDANGRRIKKTVTATQESTVFVYDVFGKMVAEYSNIQSPTPRTSYLTTDVVNSVRVITDELGQVVSRRDFKPFGEELYANTPNRSTNQKYGFGDNVRKKFAGYDRDSETDLDFAEARYYNGKHGRFTAVDPLAASGKSSNPQTFNRYVYAGNNPLKRTDPTGMVWCSTSGVRKMGSGYRGESASYTEISWASQCTSKSPPVRSHVVFIDRYTNGTSLGKYVALDPYTDDYKPFDNPSDAQNAVRQFKMQAALDFIVGVAEANSIVLELSGGGGLVARREGADDSPYQIGRRAGEGLSYVKMFLGGAAALDKIANLAARYGLKSEARLLLKGARLCCFVAGTPIHTDKGLVPIEEIKVGDKVLSYDEKTGQIEYKTVAQTFIGVKENIVKIKIRGEKLLTTTTEHPFYIKKAQGSRSLLSSGDDEEGDWVIASKLKVGQRVLRPNGNWARIISIIYSIEPTLVYNFEVESNHNYFVGEIGVLSHNCDFAKRALTAFDLGIKGTIRELKGTISLENKILNVRVDMIDGEIANPLGIVNNLVETARRNGAQEVVIEGTIVNERLYEVLVKRYGMITEGANDIIRIPIRR